MKTNEPIPTLALDDLLHMAASAIEDLLEHTDPNTSYYSGAWADVPGKLRAAAMLQAGNSTVTQDGSACKNCGGTGYFRWQQSENMCPCPCVGCDLPAAPQQEVKSALEHGMQRYAGAMQKLSEGDK
ncbi:hypothetical protein D9P45_05085 [Salmonella enterica subsp. enterica serovar Mesbit]|nr:hypothetical protein [Salmonella enterica subsp. enterica serovar Mesbit]